MPRVDTGLADQLAYQQRFSRGVRRLGGAVICGGLLLAGWPWLRFGTEDHAMVHARARAAVVGSLVMALGGALVWGRRGKLLDNTQRTVTVWWGVPWALAKTVHEIDGFQSVAVLPTQRDGATRFLVVLGAADLEPLELFDLGEIAMAHQTAAHVASFLSLPVSPPPSVD
jgi:hypothetical protein